MASVFKTQKVPFHIHSSHNGLSISDDLSTLTVPLDPPLTLPSKYKATAQMYNLSAVNSFKNISAALGNNVFTIVDNAHPTFRTIAPDTIWFKYYAGTFAERKASNANYTDANVAVAKSETLSQIEAKINAVMTGVVIKLTIDVIGDKHAVFLNVTQGSFAMTLPYGLKFITTGIINIPPEGINNVPTSAHGHVVADEGTGPLQISDGFDVGTIDTALNFEWLGQPTELTIPDGEYGLPFKNADGSITTVPSGLSDLEATMDGLIANFTNNYYSANHPMGMAPGMPSIEINTDGISVNMTLKLGTDAYSIGLPAKLEEFLGLGIGQPNGGLYPPYGTSTMTDYVVPKAPGRSPRLDDFATLQLRSGLVSALSGEGKPAAIVAQFTVPHGTTTGATFDIIPPVPLEAPCQLPNPCNELRFQLTNLRGQAADSQGNHWSATVLLTIYEE